MAHHVYAVPHTARRLLLHVLVDADGVQVVLVLDQQHWIELAPGAA